MDNIDLTTRHPATRQIARWFDYSHLSGRARAISQHCHDMAEGILLSNPDGPELTAGLRKLLEAKDCFVRAALAADEPERVDQDPSEALT